jgi:hypothetical protein
MTRIGVGMSLSRNPVQAGRAAVQAAFKQAELDGCDMLFLFATTSYDPRALLGAVREASGRAPLAGCTVRSLAAGKQAQEASPAVAVVAFKSDELKWRTAAATGAGASGGWRSAGSALGRTLEVPPRDARALWVFADGLRFDWPELMAGLAAAQHDGEACPIVGIAGADGAQMKQTLQFHGDDVLTGGAAAVLMVGGGSVRAAVEPFCRSVGLPLTITRTQGDRLLELDGRPALEVLKEYVERDQVARHGTALPWLAVELDFDRPERAVVRAVRDLDPTSGSMRVSSEIRAQMRLRLMLRDRERLMAAPARLADRLSAGAPARLAMFGGCAIGRSGLLLGADRSELGTELQRVTGAGVPWLALNGYGVLGPRGGRNELHNHAMTLTVLR